MFFLIYCSDRLWIAFILHSVGFVHELHGKIDFFHYFSSSETEFQVLLYLIFNSLIHLFKFVRH